MNVIEAIKNRGSTRAFTNEPVSHEEVEQLIDAARHAPSAGNIQPWEFIIIRDPEIKKSIAQAALNQTFIEQASVTIAVCADTAKSGRGYGSRGTDLYCIQDTAAATQNILLSAEALGLATCWIGAFNEKQVKEILNLPNEVRPLALIPVGHRTVAGPRTRPRRPIVEIIHYETY
jgi:nitroreductase